MDGIHDPGIGSAAADVPIHRLDDLLVGGMRRAVEKGDARQDHARRAVAALKGFSFEEGLMNRMQLIALRQTFDRLDLLPSGGADSHAATASGQSVDEN